MKRLTILCLIIFNMLISGNCHADTMTEDVMTKVVAAYESFDTYCDSGTEIRRESSKYDLITIRFNTCYKKEGRLKYSYTTDAKQGTTQYTLWTKNKSEGTVYETHLSSRSIQKEKLYDITNVDLRVADYFAKPKAISLAPALLLGSFNFKYANKSAINEELSNKSELVVEVYHATGSKDPDYHKKYAVRFYIDRSNYTIKRYENSSPYGLLNKIEYTKITINAPVNKDQIYFIPPSSQEYTFSRHPYLYVSTIIILLISIPTLFGILTGIILCAIVRRRKEPQQKFHKLLENVRYGNKPVKFALIGISLVFSILCIPMASTRGHPPPIIYLPYLLAIWIILIAFIVFTILGIRIIVKRKVKSI